MPDPLITRSQYWDGDPRVVARALGVDRKTDGLLLGTSRSVDDSGGLMHHLEDLDLDWLAGKGNESSGVNISSPWTSTQIRTAAGASSNQAIADTGLDVEDVVFGQAMVVVTDPAGPHAVPANDNHSRYMTTTGPATFPTSMLAAAKAQVALGNLPKASRIVYKQAAADPAANHQTRSNVGGTATAYGAAYDAAGTWERWDDEVDATSFSAGNSCQVHGKLENSSSIAGDKTSVHDGATWMRVRNGLLIHPLATGSRKLDDLINRHPQALYNGSLPLRKEPDGHQLVMIEIGTNDTSMSVAEFKADMLTLVGMLRSALPDVDIMFISMYDADGWAGAPSFRQAYQELVTEVSGTIHIDMYARQPSYAVGNASGLYGDGTHYDDDGRIDFVTNFAEVLEHAAAVANGAHYEVYRRGTLAGADTLVGMIEPGTTTIVVPGLAADSVGYYWIRPVSACGAGNNQAVSRRLRRVAMDGAAELIAPAPNAPYGLQLTPGPGGQVTATWRYRAEGAEAAAVKFQVFVATGATPFDFDTPVHNLTRVGVSNSQDLGTFADGTTVRCVVRALTDSDVPETNTNEATIEADATAPAAPVTISAEVISG